MSVLCHLSYKPSFNLPRKVNSQAGPLNEITETKAGRPDGLRHVPELGLGPSLPHPSQTEPHGMAAGREALSWKNRDFL